MFIYCFFSLILSFYSLSSSSSSCQGLASILEEEAKRFNKLKSNFKVIRRSQLDELMRRSTLTQNMDNIELEQAVKFLHECGTLLHYDDLQSNLSDLYFLDPQWLCSVMAKIITMKQLTIISKGVREREGREEGRNERGKGKWIFKRRNACVILHVF